MTFELTARCSTSELLVLLVGEEGLEPPVSNESGFTDRAATNYRLLSLIVHPTGIEPVTCCM